GWGGGELGGDRGRGRGVGTGERAQGPEPRRGRDGDPDRHAPARAGGGAADDREPDARVGRVAGRRAAGTGGGLVVAAAGAVGRRQRGGRGRVGPARTDPRRRRGRHWPAAGGRGPP